MKDKTYFLSFVEEGILNRDYEGYVCGRIEVYEIGSEKYAIERIRFLTKNQKEYHRLRGRYDFEDVTAKGLDRLRKKIIALNRKERVFFCY
jgi:hypothetical protein